MTSALNVKKLKESLNFVERYKKLSYEIFRDSLQLDDYMKWKSFCSDSKIISVSQFKSLFRDEKQYKDIYEIYAEYSHWHKEYMIIKNRSQLTLIKGGSI